MPSSFRFYRSLVAAAGLTLAAGLFAQQPPQRDYSPSDETSEGLQKFKTAMEAKDSKGAMAIIDGLLAKAAPDSYDAAYLLVQKSQLYVQAGEYSKALEPMERGIALSDSKNPTFFEERQTREIYYFLVQLYFQEASQTKNVTLALSFFDKAEKAFEKWRKLSKDVPADAQFLYVQLLVSHAMATSTPDKAMLIRALKEIETGLLLSTRPKENLYVFKLICLQQLDRTNETVDMLELLVKLKPDNAGFWSQLFSTYVNLAGSLPANEGALAKTYYVRSIVTMERAQTNGHMTAAKDNQNLISIYFNIGQYEKSAELLEAGLQKGTIDSDQKNYELLALSYQQLERPLKGIDALKRAAKAFPTSGEIELRIGQAYNGVEKPEEALPHFQAAITKGGLAKPYQAHLSIAFTAYSLKQYDVALAAAKKATEYPEAARDAQNMVKALEDIIKEREAKKNKA